MSCIENILRRWKSMMAPSCCECRTQGTLARVSSVAWVCQRCYFDKGYELYQPGLYDEFLTPDIPKS
jgi:ribosomal protein L37AE/L43A